MKIMQEFSEDYNCFVPSGKLPIKRIQQLPLPYTGNKKKLAQKIYDSINKHKIEFNTVLDAFSGSATVSFLFKLMGKTVVSNDLLTSSYFNAVAFVENPGVSLSVEEKKYLLYNDNKNKNTFVEDNYLGEKFRSNEKKVRFNKFTLKECRHLDNFRANINDLCDPHTIGLGMAANAAVVLRLPFGNVDQSSDILNHRLKQNEQYGKDSLKHDRRIGIYYDNEMNLNFNKWFVKYTNDFVSHGLVDRNIISDMKIKRASFITNLQQHILRDCFVGGRMHHGQVIAELDNRLSHQKNQLKASYGNGYTTEMDFHTDSGKPGQGMKWRNFSKTDFSGNCLAVNMDIIDLLKQKFQFDCVYFDPPYGGQSSDYCSMYRFLEEYIYSDYLENLPHIKMHGDKFVRKSNYENHFVEMLEYSSYIPTWMFSYNDSSWENVDYICEIIKKFKNNVTVEILSDQYRYLYRKKQGRQNKSTEYLIIAR